MSEYNEILDNIDANLNSGYSIKELNDEDKADVEGFAWCIHCMDHAFENYYFNCEDSIMGKMKEEIAKEICDEIYTHLICDACDLVYSHADSYEE